MKDTRIPSLVGQFNYYQQSIDQLYLIVSQYAQASGVTLDSDPVVQKLTIITFNKLRAINDDAGLAQAAGVYASTEKYLQSLTYDLLNDVYDNIDHHHHRDEAG